MTKISARRSVIHVCACTLVLLLALPLTRHAAAQDEGPECPSGFVWQRMSGVGCVQEDCLSVANAKLSYTRSCICLDEYRGCYEPVDSSGVACGPNCPASRLVACVGADALCPGEQPASEQPAGEQPASEQPAGEQPASEQPAGEQPASEQPAGEQPASEQPAGEQPASEQPAGEQPAGDPPDNATGPEPAGPSDSEAPSSGDRTPTVAVDSLAEVLEELLAGRGVSRPTPGKAAAGSAALSALIAAWVLVNAASGANIADLLRAVQRRRQGPGTSAPAGTPAATKTPPAPTGTKQASTPAMSLSTSGTIPGQKPASTPPASGAAAGAAPVSTPARKQPAKGKPDGTPEVTPEKLETLRRRFQQTVSQKIKNGYHVRNTDFVRKAWNQVPGRFLDIFSGHKGGQCGAFAKWGKQWSEPMVRELFGKGAIIDYITVDEQTTRVQQGLEDKIDSLFTSNHAATRVTLPNGESYILDYWSAVGDQQVSWGTDVAYQQIFGGPAPRKSIQLIPEKEWIKTWREKIGWDDSEVHNMNYAQQELKQSIRDHGSEEAGIQAWRDSNYRGVQDHQMETVINSYQKNGVWWER